MESKQPLARKTRELNSKAILQFVSDLIIVINNLSLKTNEVHFGIFGENLKLDETHLNAITSFYGIRPQLSKVSHQPKGIQGSTSYRIPQSNEVVTSSAASC